MSDISLFFAILWAERIVNYNSKVKILPNGELDINEQISYDFEDTLHHTVFTEIFHLQSKRNTPGTRLT